MQIPSTHAAAPLDLDLTDHVMKVVSSVCSSPEGEPQLRRRLLGALLDAGFMHAAIELRQYNVPYITQVPAGGRGGEGFEKMGMWRAWALR